MRFVHQDADGNARLAEKPFELLVRRRFPAGQCAAPVGVYVWMKFDEKLEAAAVAQLTDGPVRRERRLVFGNAHR